MFKVARVVLLAAVMMAPPLVSHAARDHSEPKVEAMSYELVVFEVDGCIYCDVFKRDVLPAIADGRVSPVVDRAYAFGDLPQALARMEANRHVGKIVLLGDGPALPRNGGWS